jgi:hypothetical protein
MEPWYCFACKEKIVEDDIDVSYMDITRFLSGLVCPKCGAAYLTEEMVVETVNPGEETLESKFGEE